MLVRAGWCAIDDTERRLVSTADRLIRRFAVRRAYGSATLLTT